MALSFDPTSPPAERFPVSIVLRAAIVGFALGIVVLVATSELGGRTDRQARPAEPAPVPAVTALPTTAPGSGLVLPTGCSVAAPPQSPSARAPASPAVPSALRAPTCQLDVVSGGVGVVQLATASPSVNLPNWITISPSHGVATLTGGTLVYTPATGYVGPDRLVYEAGEAGSGVAGEIRLDVLAPPAALEIRLPRGVTFGPGEPVGVSWTVPGADADAGMLLRVQAPGIVESATGPYAEHPGARPPNGPAYYLRPEGSWSTVPTPYASAARSGETSLVLPTTIEGAWRVEVALQDRATGTLRGAAAQTILVGSRPAIYLETSRPLARPGAPIRAQVTLNTTSSQRPVRVIAGLTRPDGTDVPLATGSEGETGSRRLVLLDRGFADDATGRYRVWAQLVDRETGVLLGLADAGFAVCDDAATVHGILVDPGGQALSLTGAAIASAVAVDVDTGAIVATAPFDPSGRYRLTVRPGRYLIIGQIVDGTGWRQASALDVVALGCGGSDSAVDLIADPPRLSPGLVVAPPRLVPPASPGPSCPTGRQAGAVPVITLDARFAGSASNEDSADPAVADVFAGDLVGAAPGVSVASAGSRGAVATLAWLPAALPDDGARRLADAPSAGATSLLLVLRDQAVGDRATLAASLVDVARREVIWTDQITPPAGTTGLTTGLIADLAGRLARPGGQSLACFLSLRRAGAATFSPSARGDRPSAIARPATAVDFGLAVDRSSPATAAPVAIGGQPLGIRVTVRVDGAALATLPVAFALRGPGTLSASSAQTDAAGTAIVQYVPPAAGTGATVLAAVVVVDDRSFTRTLTIHYRSGGTCGAGDVRFCVVDLGPLAADPVRDRSTASADRALGGSGTGIDVSVRPVDHVDYVQQTIDSKANVSLSQVYTVGDDGEMVGYGTVGGQPHVVLLTPR